MKTILLVGNNHIVVDKFVRDLVYDHFTVPKVAYVQVGMRKMRKEYDKSLFRAHKGMFVLPQGFLSKLEGILKEKGIKYTIDGQTKYKAKLLKIDGVDYRDIQEELLEKALKSHRGVLKAYTSFGKTIAASALFKAYLTAYKGNKGLFIAHTSDLIYQAAEEFQKFGLNAAVWKGKDRPDADIVCATRQTLARLDKKDLNGKFFIVIRDEVHNSGDGYRDIMINTDCPVRYGVTATLPNKPEAIAEVEGSIGPVLGEITIQEGSNKGFLAVPEITFLGYHCTSPHAAPTYAGAYYETIVQNAGRNDAIIKLAAWRTNFDESSLIFVHEIEHGEILLKAYKKLFGDSLDVRFVHGKTSKEERMRTKKLLEAKKIKIVICSTIWNEGISIKSLNNCILAGARKDEKMVLQVVGRGTRIDTGKTSVRIFDFLDQGKYIANHAIQRMHVYAKNGWKVSSIHVSHIKEMLK